MLVFVVGCFAMFLVKNRHYGGFFVGGDLTHFANKH